MLLATEPVGGGAAARVNHKLYYGWVVAVVAGLAMLTAGNFQYIFGVFVRPLIDNFGWSRAAVAGSVSVRCIVTSISSPIAGALSDRFGARKFILAGVLLIGLSYLLVSRVTSLWQLYLSLGILIGVGMSLLVVPAVATVTRWFGGKSALANGIVFSGFGLAQVILPPLATMVILRYGWGVCFLGFAALAWVGGGIAWYYIKPAPPGAPSWSPDSKAVAAPKPEAVVHRTEESWTFSAAVRTRTLWNLVIVYVVVAICYQIITIHIVAAAIDVGIDSAAAAVILTFSGVTNTVGRLTVPSLAGKFGSKNVLVISLAAQAVLLFFLIGAKDLFVLYILAAAYGLFYGGIPPMMPSVSGDYFGTGSLGAIFGLLMSSFTAGGAIGPLAAGYIHDVTGQYHLAFLAAAIAMTLAFLLGLLLKPPTRRHPDNRYRC